MGLTLWLKKILHNGEQLLNIMVAMCWMKTLSGYKTFLCSKTIWGSILDCHCNSTHTKGGQTSEIHFWYRTC